MRRGPIYRTPQPSGGTGSRVSHFAAHMPPGMQPPASTLGQEVILGRPGWLSMGTSGGGDPGGNSCGSPTATEVGLCERQSREPHGNGASNGGWPRRRRLAVMPAKPCHQMMARRPKLRRGGRSSEHVVGRALAGLDERSYVFTKASLLEGPAGGSCTASSATVKAVTTFRGINRSRRRQKGKGPRSWT
ncbi:MAG: hypothetical protein QOG46_406 [Pseudonocardiales bacterium]|jgi:hypothetical protein|nr:hypothetical protein [Pseudonocardiales bacterium]